jgi:hypothetical protein
VKTKVTEDGVTQLKPLIVADAELASNSWTYLLKDDDGKIQGGNTWFKEVDVRPNKT